MEQNVGNLDRIVRIVAGLVLAAVGAAALAGVLTLGFPVAVVALVVGLVFLGTGLTQRCLLYRPFGISTLKRR